MWIFSVFLITLSIFFHYRFQKNSSLRRFYRVALVLKLLSGVILYEVYRYFYELGDMSFYWIDATRLSDFFWKDTGNYVYFLIVGKLPTTWNYVFATEGERAFFFVRYLSLICLLASKNVYLTCLFSSFAAFIGLWACANELVIFFKKFTSFSHKKIEWSATIAFFFVPSVTFWASSMMKESLLWLLIGLLLTFWLQLIQLKFTDSLKTFWFPKFVKLISIFVLTYLLFLLKYYYFAVIASLLVAYTSIFIFFRDKSFKIQLVLFSIIFIGIVSLVSNLHPNLWLSRLAEAIYLNQNHILETSPIENQIPFINRNATIWSMLYNAPLALFSGLFLPLHWESFKILKIIAVVENWIVVILFVQTLRLKNFTLSSPSFKTDFARLFWWTGILFCLIMATLLALAAPNVGALVRYKIGFLPFWVFGILLRID